MSNKELLINRRHVLLGAAAANTLSLLPRGAAAASGELVIANWGGIGTEAIEVAVSGPYKALTGTSVVVDPSGPTAGKIRAMVEAGQVSWDVCDATSAACLELGRAGLLEEIDYDIVPKSLTLPEFALPHGVGSYAYSNVIVYDNAAFPDEKPVNWADFWNVEKFPGRRLLRGDVTAMLEGALLADGVTPENLYPLDVDRGLRKIAEIKSHCLFWGSAAESIQMLRSGEAVMANTWNSRAADLVTTSGGRYSMSWDQAILQPAIWVIPKNNPGGREAAMDLIKFLQAPEPAIEYAKHTFVGPLNPEAAAALPEDLRPLVPTAPENMDKQIPMDVNWYAENYSTVLPRYMDLIAS
ncbi:ABC transporter substrate-binding protein [Mesorhizobium sp. L-8-10]|uniref:polyamine ABC transporter substrate-binding protein n=1 Tax=Mesorhizobium sp. L-8-10 TaxID=2744523 RepID=UPI001926E794|nr:ABC transporter substrate-binding protein [Mesorhizobium sp. L-8-10]BCH29876.1 ABC transporter substrate-binding protein [Mesorhizobium sp. L-8-10]